MQACFAAFMAVTECKKERHRSFHRPGFPVQKHKCKSSENRSSHLTFIITGAKNYGRNWKSIFQGNIAAILYSNPNNPAWICFTDEELKIVGELATKYDVIVLEDLAYFAMDFRRDLSVPGKAPFQPSVGKYTDNYIVMISGSNYLVTPDNVWESCVFQTLYTTGNTTTCTIVSGNGYLGLHYREPDHLHAIIRNHTLLPVRHGCHLESRQRGTYQYPRRRTGIRWREPTP